MIKYFKLHKEAKELLRQGAELIDKSKYTSLEEWEVERFVKKAIPLADQCAKVALPNDVASLYICASVLDCQYNSGVPINDESYQQFIEMIYDKKSSATNKFQVIAYNECIKQIQKLVFSILH